MSLAKALQMVAKSSKVLAPKTGTTGRKVVEKGLSLDELRDAYKLSESQRKIQVPSIAKAAEDLELGNISKQEYDKIVKKDNPIIPINEMPEVPSLKRIEAVLGKKAEKGILGKDKDPSNLEGMRVSNRLDIPAYDNYDTWVVSIHKSKGPGQPGPVEAYGQSAYLTDVVFHTPSMKAPQTKAMKIAKGGAKNPFAGMDGTFKNVSTEDAYAIAQRELNNPDSEWIQVGMNPHRHSYFYDKADSMPVLAADEVIQVGPLVLAKNARKGNPADYEFKAGGRIERNPYNYESKAI